MAFVKKRSDGKFELVTSVREDGSQRKKHLTLCQMGDTKSIVTAWQRARKDMNEPMREGESFKQSNRRRLRAQRNYEVLNVYHELLQHHVKLMADQLTAPIRVKFVRPNRLRHGAVARTEEARKVADQKLAADSVAAQIAHANSCLLRPHTPEQMRTVAQILADEKTENDALLAKMRGLLKGHECLVEELKAIKEAGAIAKALMFRAENGRFVFDQRPPHLRTEYPTLIQ
jgi:hypothetical protein